MDTTQKLIDEQELIESDDLFDYDKVFLDERDKELLHKFCSCVNMFLYLKTNFFFINRTNLAVIKLFVAFMDMLQAFLFGIVEEEMQSVVEQPLSEFTVKIAGFHAKISKLIEHSQTDTIILHPLKDRLFDFMIYVQTNFFKDKTNNEN
jgi:hypothetical protein